MPNDSRFAGYMRRISSLLVASGGRLFLVLVILAIFLPSSPQMPTAGLDPSWVYGINQAVGQGMQFGKDLLFTYGPYGAVYTKAYHPATDLMAMIAGGCLGLSFSTAILLLVRAIPAGWAIALCALLLLYHSAMDSLFLTSAVLPALVLYRFTLPEGHALKLSSHWTWPVLAIPLFMPLGILPLVKASFFPMAVLLVCMCSLICQVNGRRMMAVWLVVVVAVTMLVFWMLAGQTLGALPYYVTGSLSLIQGYSEALALPEDPIQVLGYLGVAAGILLITFRKNDASGKSMWFLGLSFAAYLFLAFKSGFVRGDGHVEIAGRAIAFAAILLAFVSRSSALTFVFFAALIASANIDRAVSNSSTRDFFTRALHLYSITVNGIQGRLEDPTRLKNAFYEQRKAIAAERAIPILPGTTDIYSYQQAYLLASGNIWNPRPVFQSYSAYSPALAQLNAAHLQGARAPDNVVFRVEPIDGRLPALEDGLSWPLIVSRYAPVRVLDDFLYLTKRGDGTDPPPLVKISMSKHRLGETVNLPVLDAPLFAEITVKTGLVGRAVALFYKPSLLEIKLQLMQGREQTYRLISSMAKTPFLLSPLVQDTTDFAFMFGEAAYLRGQRVRSIRVSASGRFASLWEPQYDLTLHSGSLSANHDVGKLFAYDSFQERAPEFEKGQPAVTCSGVIDLIRGSSPSAAPIEVWRDLPLSGWLMLEDAGGLIRSEVYVSLAGKAGDVHYLKARKTPRPDVKAAYKSPTMPDPGYEVRADVSKLSGRYELGIGFVYKGKLHPCGQLKQTILVGK